MIIPTNSICQQKATNVGLVPRAQYSTWRNTSALCPTAAPIVIQEARHVVTQTSCKRRRAPGDAVLDVEITHAILRCHVRCPNLYCNWMLQRIPPSTSKSLVAHRVTRHPTVQRPNCRPCSPPPLLMQAAFQVSFLIPTFFPPFSITSLVRTHHPLLTNLAPPRPPAYLTHPRAPHPPCSLPHLFYAFLFAYPCHSSQTTFLHPFRLCVSTFPVSYLRPSILSAHTLPRPRRLVSAFCSTYLRRSGSETRVPTRHGMQLACNSPQIFCSRFWSTPTLHRSCPLSLHLNPPSSPWSTNSGQSSLVRCLPS